jgi:hypothetical protein
MAAGDDVTCVYDDVTYVYDDVTCADAAHCVHNKPAAVAQ